MTARRTAAANANAAAAALAEVPTATPAPETSTSETPSTPTFDLSAFAAKATKVEQMPTVGGKLGFNPFTAQVKESADNGGTVFMSPGIPAEDKGAVTRVYNAIHKAARDQSLTATVRKIPTTENDKNVIVFYYTAAKPAPVTK